MIEKCLLCVRDGAKKTEFKSLNSHLQMKHKMKRDEYTKFADSFTIEETVQDDIFKEEHEPEKKITTNSAERVETIFKVVEEDSNLPIQHLLDTYGMTFERLKSILNKYKTGSTLDIKDSIKEREEKAKIRANSLANRDEVETANAVVAEVLVKQHGFKCVQVTSTPERWYLEKG